MKKFLLLLFFPPLLHAQTTYHQQQYWIRYQNTLTFSKKISLISEIDNRRFFNPDVQAQLIGHMHAHLKLSPSVDVAGGYTLSWVYGSLPEMGYQPARGEIRPFVEGNHKWTNKNFSFLNRLRIDNRFLQQSPDIPLWDDSRFSVRFRYRFIAQWDLGDETEHHHPIKIKLGDELMVNAMGTRFDQNRLFLNTEIGLSKNLALELGYIYLHQQKFGSNEFYSRQVARVTLMHALHLK